MKAASTPSFFTTLLVSCALASSVACSESEGKTNNTASLVHHASKSKASGVKKRPLTKVQKKKIKKQKKLISQSTWKLEKAVKVIRKTDQNIEKPLPQRISSDELSITIEFSFNNSILINDQWLISYKLGVQPDSNTYTEISLDLSETKNRRLRLLFGRFLRSRLQVSENQIILSEPPKTIFNEKDQLQMEWREYVFSKVVPPQAGPEDFLPEEDSQKEQPSTEGDTLLDDSFLNNLSDEELLNYLE